MLRTLKGVTTIPRGRPLPCYDAHLPLMSLPHILGIDTATLRQQVPYLFAEPSRVGEWAGRLPGGALRVGIAWQGNPKAKADKGRSIPLRMFSPLCRIPGLTLISLQKGAGVAQLADLPPGMKVETLGAEFDAGGAAAFLDTAAVMTRLDLVICSDSSIAHLAGALGRPVWIALKYLPDWRWMTDSEDTPWYPTARLFRQTRRDDWQEVFERITAELARVAAGSGGPQ